MTNAIVTTHTDHPVRLCGLRTSNAVLDVAPLIIKRQDQDFIEGLLSDLSSETQRAGLQQTVPPRKTVASVNALRLLQPVQRTFHLAVLEAFCDMPGQPRVDRSKIESAGLVVRRIDGNRKLAWVKAGTKHFGWESINEEVDPALDKRQLPYSVGNAYLNARLASNWQHSNAGAATINAGADVTEQIYPLFVAPPEVCAAAAKTLLFAHVPVTGSEQAEAPDASAAAAGNFPPAANYGVDDGERADLQKHLVHYLKAGAAKTLPAANTNVTADIIKTAAAQEQDDENTTVTSGRLGTFMLLLQQLHIEFDAFGDGTAAKALFAKLNQLQVETDDSSVPVKTSKSPAGDFLRRAKDVLLERASGSFAMPSRWSAVAGDVADEIFKATLACLEAQYKKLKPAQGRFDNPNAIYVLRAFVRVKSDHADCPSRLVWSTYSAPFTVAPWYEAGDAAPTTIALPDLFDRNVLNALKPNVAFTMPPKLAKLLQGDPKKLATGEGSADGFSIGWICSFSIPIITLCAFIVLNIFLSLFNIIFFWMPLLKICIPYPKSKS